MSYRIGSFNCRHLGKASAANKDLSHIAQIINGEEFDVVALQELHGKAALLQLLDKLKKEQTRPSLFDWDGEADNEVSDYGFIWNKKRLRCVETTVNGGKRIYQPRIYKQYRLDRTLGQKKFVRNPYYARFEPCHAASPFIELRLVNIHIRFSKGQDGTDDSSPSAILMRQNEFDVLSRVIFPYIEDRVYGNSRTESSYTIILGDYNLNLKREHTHSPYLAEKQRSIIDGRREKELMTTQDQLTTLKKPKEPEKIKIKEKETADDNPFSNNFDHCTFNQLRIPSIIQIDAAGQYSCLTEEGIPRLKVSRVDILKYLHNYETYLQTVSDHVPIKIELILK